MPCYVSDEQREVLSVKVATVFDRNVPDRGLPTTMAYLLLHDACTGELIALMDAEFLTAMRTGAASALATSLLALPDASVVTIFGAGAQSETQLAGMAHVRPITRAFVVDKNPVRAFSFANRMSSRLEIEVEPASSIDEAIRASQILCAATNSIEPVFDGSLMQPGTHVNAIGSFREGARELDDNAVSRSRVFVDDLEAAKAGAGDLIQAVSSGQFSWDRVAGELGSLLNGKVAGRQSADETTVYKSVGLAVQDAFAASWVYDQAIEQGLGIPFALA